MMELIISVVICHKFIALHVNSAIQLFSSRSYSLRHSIILLRRKIPIPTAAAANATDKTPCNVCNPGSKQMKIGTAQDKFPAL